MLSSLCTNTPTEALAETSVAEASVNNEFNELLEGFLEFDRSAAPTPSVPFITLQRKGLMSLNRAAFQALGSPTAVTLLYHPERRVIGLRPADPSSPRAYPVRIQGSGSTYIVAGAAFTQFHGIPTNVARRYSAKLVGDVLTLDLTQDAPDVTGPRAKERRDGEPIHPAA